MEANGYKVVIVDDEVPIRDMLRDFNWAKYGCKLVGEAANGKSALDLCSEITPDIVIADITMPVMDGMELFERLHIQFPFIKVIILTCHDEFGYVKEALKLGAVDYVVKVSLREDEMGAALRKACEMLEREKLIYNQENKIKRISLSRVFANNTSGVDINEEAIFEILEQNGITPNFTNRQILLYIEAQYMDWFFIDDTVQNILSKLPEIKNNILLGTGTYILFMKKEYTNESDFIEELIKIIDILYSNSEINKYTADGSIRFYIALSNIIYTRNEFIAFIKSYNYWKQISFYFPRQKIFTGVVKNINYIDKKLRSKMYEFFTRIYNNQTISKQQVYSDFKELFYGMVIKHEELKSTIISILDEIEATGEVKADNSVHNIWMARNIDELVESIFIELRIINNKKCGYRLEIRKAIELINMKYHEPISLSGIAEEVNISSQYLGRLFRDETEQSFNEFVTRVRMENAVKLLKETNLKVFEVAEKIGIPNYRYFSTLFKNWTGVAPKDYKRR